MTSLGVAAGIGAYLFVAPAEPPASATGDQPSPPPAKATAADAGDLAAGEALYALHCASCHGAHGEGQPNWKVPLPDGSLPAPPHDDSGHTWHHPDAQLLAIIADGGTLYMPQSTMPGFRAQLSPGEMEAVLSYIKGWWSPESASYQAEMTARELQWNEPDE